MITVPDADAAPAAAAAVVSVFVSVFDGKVMIGNHSRRMYSTERKVVVDDL